MRILYIHQHFVTPAAAGGTRSFEFARRLVARGHHVRIIASHVGCPLSWNCSQRGVRKEEGVELSVVRVRYSNRMRSCRRIVAFLRFAIGASFRALLWKPDLVFGSSTPLTVAMPAIVGAARWRVPMVFEVRDVWPELPIAVGALRNPLAIWLARRLEQTAYQWASEIIVLSPGMRDAVMGSGVAGDKVTVIPNACDNKIFNVSPSRGARFRARVRGLPLEQPLLVYAGAFGRINQVEYLVKLAAGLRSIHSRLGVLLVGDGAERDAVIESARRNGLLGKGVWVSDPVPKREMPDVLAAATVCASVFAPIKEMENNSANKFFDALAAGKPVVINYGGWQAELLQSSGAGIVLPFDDIHAAAEQLHAFVSDPARLAAAGQAARRLAEERFDRDRLADQLEAVLIRALAKGGRRARG